MRECMLGYKTCLDKFQWIQIIHMFSDHNRIKLEAKNNSNNNNNINNKLIKFPYIFK